MQLPMFTSRLPFCKYGTTKFSVSTKSLDPKSHFPENVFIPENSQNCYLYFDLDGKKHHFNGYKTVETSLMTKLTLKI